MLIKKVYKAACIISYVIAVVIFLAGALSGVPSSVMAVIAVVLCYFFYKAIAFRAGILCVYALLYVQNMLSGGVDWTLSGICKNELKKEKYLLILDNYTVNDMSFLGNVFIRKCDVPKTARDKIKKALKNKTFYTQYLHGLIDTGKITGILDCVMDDRIKTYAFVINPDNNIIRLSSRGV